MANIATCPKCAKQLGLPANVAMTDRAECPECQAVFSLSETVQISLPVARVLDPSEQPMTAASLPMEESQPTVEGDTTDALASNTAPLKSWEERLKNALAKDTSEGSASADESVAEAVPTTPADSSPPPSFEFELDLSTPADLEKDRPQVPAAASKTLADFAAAAEIPAGEEIVPRAEPIDTGKAADTVDMTSEPTVAELLPTEVAAEATAASTELAELAVQTVPQRRTVRRGFPKIAALAVGPVVGSLLGLYGLLWLQGAKADYLGLSRVLPASMLPESMQPAGLSNSSLAGASSLQENLGAEENASLLTQPQDQSVTMKHDASVQPASAAQQVAPEVSMARISVDEFGILVDAAVTALPEFLAGDLATPESIRSKGQAYMALCRLADHFDFALQPGLAPNVQAKVRQALQLYSSAASQTKHRQELSHIASRWWGYEQRPSEGIFLAGQVQKTQPAGTGMLCWVMLSEQSTVEPIPVLFKHQRHQVGDQIGIVGSVISSPSELPAGLPVRQVVRAAYDFQLGL